MRISVLLLSCCIVLPATLHAQDPGAQQDAEAAREKLLKAADQLDMIESNSEATKTSLDAMKADLAKLQDENTTLKQQLADLQAAFDKSEAEHAKERQVLLDEVAKMVAAGKSGSPGKPPKKKETVVTTEPPADVPASVAATTSATNTEVSPPPDSTSSTTPPAEPAPPKPQKGYYHVVETGETLTLICNAYRQQGINVTVAEVQKANGLTDKSVLKVGQKLFIPKPGT